MNRTQLYPLFADISEKKVLVVGGGGVAQEKIERLLECGARVMVISPEVTGQIEQWAAEKRLKLRRRVYCKGDVKWAWMVIVACAVPEVNTDIYGQCMQRRIFCNVVDVIDLCMFQVPAVSKHGPLQIAISTSGISPALAKILREDMDQQFDASYETFLEALAELRTHLKEKYPDDLKKRSDQLEAFVLSEALSLLQQGNQIAFENLLERYRGD